MKLRICDSCGTEVEKDKGASLIYKDRSEWLCDPCWIQENYFLDALEAEKEERDDLDQG